ncbi:MAG: preprotein translocase subunit SecY [Firmicutes bacterium]|uniref:Protein translocase subunit SecY n=1 Tax=Candidatus Onthovivens merdipullorum TaxID=2840889 RepID=A0A9D9GWJ2_9BACL|nr:preprotein translocase subunit SecY [Candidatus Onthovivens merdipullorum]
MKKFIQIFKNKEVVNRIFFTIMILFVFRIGAAITAPGITVNSDVLDQSNNVFALMNLLGGGALQNFSIFALGVSPYITAQIIIQLLSMDVLPALSELTKQGQYGRKKIEMATRYLTLMLAAVQAYGIIQTAQNTSWITFNFEENFLNYAYVVSIMVAGAMLVMWLGDQITSKGIGNGISVIIFAGIVASLPNQIYTGFSEWVLASWNTGSKEAMRGVFQFVLYIACLIAIVAFVIYIELARRKIPVQHATRSGGSEKLSKASFLPIKINSAGVIPVIFASSIMMAPSVIASFISEDAMNASWLQIFQYNQLVNTGGVMIPWGLIIYLVLILLFTYFYANLQINPDRLAENFQKNGSYIPGIRPGVETANYVKKVLNRVTFIGAISLMFIAALPVVLTLTVFNEDPTLAIGGTGLIIVVGVALELNNQINGLIAGKSYDEVIGGM